jgi:glycosyltransferase involved in cell wall biosynthesis
VHLLMTVNAAWNIWNFRRSLVAGLLSDGHRITVLAPPDDSVGDLERLGCRFLPLEMRVKGVNPLEDLKLMRRFKTHFRTERPDVVLSYTIKNNIFGAMAADAVGVPFLPNVTGLGTAFLSGGLMQTVAERLYRRAFGPRQVIFFQNEDDQALFVARRLAQARQSRLLPGSGIDLERFAATPLPPAEQPPVFLMIARLLRDKGVVEFVEAARQIKAKQPAVRFQLLGAVGVENRSAIDAATLQGWVDSGIVEYLGTTPDVRPAIAAATCVVLPSYREGAPRTLIEAAAMARPLIATDVPGCRAVVDPGESGFFCEVRSADSLAAAVAAFLALPHEARAAMGVRGRAKMEREFDEALILQAYRQAIGTVARAA